MACPLSRTNSLTMPATATQGEYFSSLVPIAPNALNWIIRWRLLAIISHFIYIALQGKRCCELNFSYLL